MEEIPYQISFSPTKFCRQLWEVLCGFAGHHLLLNLCHDFILHLLFGIISFLYILTDGQQLIQMSTLILKVREDRGRITTTVWGRGLNTPIKFKSILPPSISSHHLGPVEGLLCLMENASIGARFNLQGLLPWKALGNQFLCHVGIVLWTAQDGDKQLILLLLLPDWLSTAMDVHFQGLEVMSVLAGEAKRMENHHRDWFMCWPVIYKFLFSNILLQQQLAKKADLYKGSSAVTVQSHQKMDGDIKI